MLFKIFWSKLKVAFLPENHTLKKITTRRSQNPKGIVLMVTCSLIFHFINLCLKRMNEKPTSKCRLSSSISRNFGNSALDCFFCNHASSKLSKQSFQTQSSPDSGDLPKLKGSRQYSMLSRLQSTICWWRQASNLGSGEFSLIPGAAICSSWLGTSQIMCQISIPSV